MAFGKMTMVALAALVALVSAASYTHHHLYAPMDPECNPCTPQIDNHTTIEPVPGLRATVEIIADYGSCSPAFNSYQWRVSWGDGVESIKNISYLSPEQAQYTYQAPGTYNVSVAYCAYPQYCCLSCTYLSKVLTISG
ncbi:uncharacterized protein MONBRDRAFT_29235 [Monosiga brevicollis MX1]|uniref:PKD domain-containing protein n=1 Tax=Monosiga brevicollis TaxID=81824 RepID=A9VAI2_MONBE|nr:uncharacterized protein MONBRDRAFT_29235 [Monosiga brevicollis MX1]EDQ85491.1 predicted protein [Monosiga brevicollis MX1]|eukprot:XP_001749682.1 hypothetical protein [Monosiga brevicollis MX1]